MLSICKNMIRLNMNIILIRNLIDQYSKFGEDSSRSDREFQTAIQANPDLIRARQFWGK